MYDINTEYILDTMTSLRSSKKLRDKILFPWPRIIYYFLIFLITHYNIKIFTVDLGLVSTQSVCSQGDIKVWQLGLDHISKKYNCSISNRGLFMKNRTLNYLLISTDWSGWEKKKSKVWRNRITQRNSCEGISFITGPAY